MWWNTLFLNEHVFVCCIQYVCALCFADSSCAGPWWPLSCQGPHTHTHTGVAGCWGVGSGALGGSRGFSQWVSVSCLQQFVLREQYGEREMSSLIHQPTAASAPLGPVCPHSKTSLNIPACAGCDLLTGTQCVEVVGPVSSTWMPLPRASISTIILSACGKHC